MDLEAQTTSSIHLAATIRKGRVEGNCVWDVKPNDGVQEHFQD